MKPLHVFGLSMLSLVAACGGGGSGATTACTMGASQTVTTWVYAGNTATEMMACTSNGQTWITP